MGAAILVPALISAVGIGVSVQQAEKSRKASSDARQEALTEQRRVQKEQELLLKTRPRKVEPGPRQSRRESFRRGLAQNLRTAGGARGVQGTPTLSTASLTAGKTKLGQ